MTTNVPTGEKDWLEEQAESPEHKALLDEAERMLRAGYAVTRIDWIALKDASKDAFQAAGNLVAAERAALAGLAAQGIEQYAEVVAPADNGDTKIRLAIAREAQRLQADIRRKSEGAQ